MICDLNEEGLANTVTEIEQLGAQALGVRCDVSSSESVTEMFERIAARFGTLHILVNNAALVQNQPAEVARRDRFYEYLTTPMPRQSLGFTKT